MNTPVIVAAIDAEISRLQHIRSLLAEVESIGTASKPGRGRPTGSKNVPSATAPKKRVMSEEGKARIAAAQKKRWAALKKSKYPSHKRSKGPTLGRAGPFLCHRYAASASGYNSAEVLMVTRESSSLKSEFLAFPVRISRPHNKETGKEAANQMPTQKRSVIGDIMHAIDYI